MLDISNVASDSVSFYQVLSPGLPWFVLMFLVKRRWERSLDRTKVPRSLTYMMQLSWNVRFTIRKHSRVILHGSRAVTERENGTWSWRSAYGVAGIDLDYANLQEENCRRIDEYWFTYFFYKHLKIWDQARVFEIMLDLNQGLTKLKYSHEAMSALISNIPTTSSTTISRIREA